MSTSSLFAGKLVRLAAPLPEDAEIIAYWSRDDEYCRQVDTAAARPLSPQQANEFNTSMIASPNGYLFHLRTLDDDRLIGFVAIHSIEWNNQAGTFATGIWDPEYRGKGYGREAIRLALNYAFNELNLYRLGLDVIADNPRAIRAYERAGFQHEGALRGAVYRDGRRTDRLLMGILRPEWLASQGQGA